MKGKWFDGLMDGGGGEREGRKENRRDGRDN